MQQQQTIPSAPVHVKVALDNEFRRFLLSPTTFDNLYTKLKTLFNLQTDFRIKFQDDENDWVLIMTDQELVYATELSGSPLRLQVQTVDAEPNPLPTTQCGRGKFGRGCRGGRGGKGGKAREERLLQKSSRLTERIGQLEAKLQSNNKLTSERERILRWKNHPVTGKISLGAVRAC